jgi:20S proteasome alpha/beta subunit
MTEFGYNERQARAFLDRELEKTASSTSFYWESEDVEEALELIVDAVAKLIAENNKRFKRDWEQELRRIASRR